MAELDWDDSGSLRQDIESEVWLQAGHDVAILAKRCPGIHSMTFEVATI